ncbi:MAG: ribosome maturation factor RimM [Bacteroidota bacterium]
MIHIGYTGKAHGLGGEIKLKIMDAYWEDFDTMEVVFVKKGGTAIPYFIESVRDGNATIVKFEDIENRNQAEAIESKQLFARTTDITIDDSVKPELKHLVYGHLLGFNIIEENLGTIGQIIDVLDYPQQEMAVFEYNNVEQMLPLNDHFILKIDPEKKMVHVSVPEGLFDL